jgi:hypothetical protein
LRSVKSTSVVTARWSLKDGGVGKPLSRLLRTPGLAELIGGFPDKHLIKVLPERPLKDFEEKLNHDHLRLTITVSIGRRSLAQVTYEFGFLPSNVRSRNHRLCPTTATLRNRHFKLEASAWELNYFALTKNGFKLSKQTVLEVRQQSMEHVFWKTASMILNNCSAALVAPALVSSKLKHPQLGWRK